MDGKSGPEGKRQSKPPPRTTYAKLGVPTEVQPEATTRPEVNRASPTPSSNKSTVSSVKDKAIEEVRSKKALHNLKKEYERKKFELEKELRQIEKSTGPELSEAANEKLDRIEALKTELEDVKMAYEMEKKFLEEECELQKMEIDAHADEEQYLGPIVETDCSYTNKVERLERHEVIPRIIPGTMDEDNDEDCSDEEWNQEYRPEPRRMNHRERDPMSMIAEAIQKMGRGKPKDLPIFEGKPENWPIFFNEYERTTREHKISNSANIIRIRKALKGSAREAVEGLLDDPSCIDEIISVLKSRYGRPEFVLRELIKKARDAKPPDVKKPETMVAFGTTVQNLVARVKSMGKKNYLNDITLLHELVLKLPSIHAERWVEWQSEDPSREENLEYFGKWIRTRVAIAEKLQTPTCSEAKEEKEIRPTRARKKGMGVHAAVKNESDSDTDKRGTFCLKCGKSNHKLEKCFAFKKMDLEGRKEVLKKAGACYSCFGTGHRSSKCRKPAKCEEKGCKYPTSHHTLLHEKTWKKEKPPEPREDEERREEPDVQLSLNTFSSRHNILPIIPVILKGPTGKKKRTFALLDTGASFCMMEQSLADDLGLEGPADPLNYSVFQDSRKDPNSRRVSLKISGDFNRAPFYAMDKVHTVKKMNLPARDLDAAKMKKGNPHLANMNVKSLKNARPQLLIGINRGGLFAARKILEPAPGEAPAAVKSLLGWYLIEDGGTASNHLQFMTLDEEMHHDIREFVCLENLGVRERQSNRSKEDEKAMRIFEETASYEDNRWTIGLPWKNDDVKLPPSYDMALSRLRGMERKMAKNKEFRELCNAKFKEYLDAGYLREVRPEQNIGPKKWYLPWFFAYHPSKKPRLVFDGAAKALGKSLNDFLLTGPDLLQPLNGVLLRFRRHSIALTSDIKSMFHQVQLKKEDWKSQTILYRSSPGEPIKELVMTVLFFGAASSPSQACYIKDRNASKYEEKYPETVRAIHRDFYVDDFLSGAETVDKAIQLQKQATEIHELGGFPLVKWNSSNREVLDAIPLELQAENGEMKLKAKSDVEWEKTLGLLWDPITDMFSFKLSPEKIPEKIRTGEIIPTKRMVTSVVMSVFDPLGFLAIIKMKGLLIIQRIWKTGIGWDDTIDNDTFELWMSWLEDVQQKVTAIRIPRRLAPVSLKDVTEIELHIFCDASEMAYACAAYLRIVTRGSVITPLVMGKVRIGPIKGLTIPRMELNAALIGCRIATFIKKSFDEDMNIAKTVFWTDSMTVLQWIRSTNLRLKTYVANRIGEICESSSPEDWKWVPSAENVADDATKIKNENLTEKSRWFTGPAFLRLPPSDWPKEKESLTEDNEEVEHSVQVATKMEKSFEIEILPDKEKFSSWYRLIRATAIRFVVVRRFKRIKPYHITLEDMMKSEAIWITAHQEVFFGEEKSFLIREGVVPRKSRISQLSPLLDKNGLIVVGSRLENADIEGTLKNPPILDPKDRYVRLMIHWYHNLGQHYGQERLINELRRKAWILHLRTAVKKCRSECIICMLGTARPDEPEMGQLPSARVNPGKKAFENTGVDYFGPLLVKVRRSREKRWGVIFTCLATRAVHVDIAESLLTSDMLNCLIRFINLRGTPKAIWSDNGTNFVGADREIRDNLEKWNESVIREDLMRRGIAWNFNPPSSPHMGGAWERLIRDVKRILKSLLHETYPTPETLRTFLSEVTGILNSRPLTFASPDPDDPRCLTPNDLLNLESVVGPTLAGDFTDHDLIRETWKRSGRLADQFWKRWSNEYLLWLAQRQKWQEKKKPLQIGDLVILLDDNSPRNGWKKGIVVRTFPAPDGQVRVAEVKVAHVDSEDPTKLVKLSLFKRPVTKLCPVKLG